MKKLLSLIVLSLLMMTSLAWAQGTVTFDEVDENNDKLWNLPTGTNYGNGSVTVDNIAWSYGGSQASQTYSLEGQGQGILLRRASDSYLQATIPNGIGTFSFQYKKAYTGNNVRQLELIVDGTQVATTSQFGTADHNDVNVIYTFNHDVNETTGPFTIKIKLVGTSNNNAHVVIDNINWTGYATSAPSIDILTKNLDTFTYVLNGGPSESQTVRVGVENFTSDDVLNVSSSMNYEIKKALSLGNYGTSVSFNLDGSPQTFDIAVRLIQGLEVGDHLGTLTFSVGSGDDKVEASMNLTGVVIAPPPEGYFVDFEGEDEKKTGYASGDVTLSGKEWNMTEALIGIDASDFKYGNRSARLRYKTGFNMAMSEDKPNGLGTLSFSYRRYGTDTKTTWKVEYSIDEGANWTGIGNSFEATEEVSVFSEDVNVAGNVRIRFIIGSEGTNEKRMNIDDILLTDFYDYSTGIENTVDGLGTVTFTAGNANNIIDPDMPTIPNTSITNHKDLALDLVGSGPWSIEILSTLDYCAYNWQNNWHDAGQIAGGFKINVESGAKGDKDLYIVLSNQNPTLPVELSSFMVVLNSNGNPVVTWETQSETGVNGFYIYRGVNKSLSEAALISSLIPATNSSLAHSYSFIDRDLSEEGVYYYWLNVSDLNGQESYHGPAELNVILSEEETTPEVANVTALRGIYPNPFNPSANIGFELAEASEVKISVYNTRGQLVRSFAPFTHDAGHGSIVWDGKDEGGNSVSSGIYLFRMTVGAKSYSAKALMMK